MGWLPSWAKKAVKYGVRAGTAFASGGASEVYRGVTGKTDPVTKKGEDLVDQADNAGGSGSGSTGPAPTGETEEEKARREQLQRDQDDDLKRARAYRDKAMGEPTPFARPAPQVAAPGTITPTHAGGPTAISSTLNTADADQARRAYQAYQDKLALVADGKAGPSAAELQMKRGLASTIAQQYSLAGTGHGYSSAALRAAQRNAGAISQEGLSRTGELRAQETATARTELGNAIATGRGQDITLATAKGSQELEAARANQTTKLQTDLANAGFDNTALLHMSDQELQVRLANAGFQLTQQQIEDLRLKTQRDQQLAAQGQVLDAGSGAATTAGNQQITKQQAQAQLEEARRRGDAAGQQFWATFIAALV